MILLKVTHAEMAIYLSDIYKLLKHLITLSITVRQELILGPLILVGGRLEVHHP